MASQTYSLTDRWLHWLALEPQIVRELSFDLERQFSLPRRPSQRGDATAVARDPAADAVYVCGLARSGTTLLLRLLDQVEGFRSLSYRDMPFPLAPKLWQRLSSLSPRKAVAEERIHGDGVLVDFDSPEGFEEVFWRTFTRYSTRDGRLSAAAPSDETLVAFADYRALVANPKGAPGGGGPRRYLSKNNNNLMRLEPLCREPASSIVLVFRHPAAAALSMHRTHASFCREQAKDDYMRRYMAWLCHFEFGIDHRPFAFAAAAMDTRLQPGQLDYWLDYWCAVHEHILKFEAPALHLLDYDALCRTPATVLGSLFDALHVQGDRDALASQVASPRQALEDGFDRALLDRAMALHRTLCKRFETMPLDVVA